MKSLQIVMIVGLSLIVGAAVGYSFPVLSKTFLSTDHILLSPLTEIQEQVLPLKKYSFAELKNYSYQSSEITIDRELTSNSSFTSYLFRYQTMGKSMSGVLNVPSNLDRTLEPRVLILVRGYVPAAIYTSGTGTKNAAAFFAENGYVTVAPDFFGYGESDPEFKDEWEARFAKPIQLIELIKSIETQGVPLDGSAYQQVQSSKIGIWAHSNGGQIALSSLQITERSLPITLWAPVTAPFPYSVLYHSDEEADEGKAARAWIHLFEEKYNAFDYSLTQHLEDLTGPIQLHHGVADEAAPIAWSDEFADKIENENRRRTELQKSVDSDTQSSESAKTIANDSLDEISLTYFRYPEADHNLQPNWSTAVQRDLVFFRKHL